MTSERRRARQVALQTLFEVNQTDHDPTWVLKSRVAEPDIDDGDGLPSETAQFAERLIEGVLRHREEIDRMITEVATTWSIEQMAAIDRAALELGVFEALIERRTPIQVVINEAVELAKTYGGPNSGNLVNGVLRTLAEHSAAHSS